MLKTFIDGARLYMEISYCHRQAVTRCLPLMQLLGMAKLMRHMVTPVLSMNTKDILSFGMEAVLLDSPLL